MKLKQVEDEIRTPSRPSLDASHLMALALGALLTAGILAGLGYANRRGPDGSTIHAGHLSFFEEQVDASTRHGNAFAREDRVRGRIVNDYFLITRPDRSIEVIPAARVHRAKFYD